MEQNSENIVASARLSDLKHLSEKLVSEAQKPVHADCNGNSENELYRSYSLAKEDKCGELRHDFILTCWSQSNLVLIFLPRSDNFTQLR